MHPKPLSLVAATTNRHKLREISKILKSSEIRIYAPRKPLPKVAENGKTLEANAIKKAASASRTLGCACLADDSGLFVPALLGQPGVRSARYAGPTSDYIANNAKLLRHMDGLKGRERRAYFATTMAVVAPGKKPLVRTGKIWGRIALMPAGQKGFGYDPVFVPLGSSLTYAQMPLAQKNRISHRALALKKIVSAFLSKPA